MPLLALFVATLGCTDPVETFELGVYNWWQRPSEEEAFRHELADAMPLFERWQTRLEQPAGIPP